MSTKAKIFPCVPALILAASLGLGCGGATTPTQESPCDRGCADGFVACIESCGDDGTCRDECMIERSDCAQGCGTPEPPTGDAGAAPG